MQKRAKTAGGQRESNPLGAIQPLVQTAAGFRNRKDVKKYLFCAD